MRKQLAARVLLIVLLEIASIDAGPNVSSFALLATDSAYIFRLPARDRGALGGFDAISAATTTINGPFTVTGTVGIPLANRRLTTSGHVAASWSSGTEPVAPGLTLSLSGTISGTPTEVGSFTNTITGWEFPRNVGPSTSSTFLFNFAAAAPPPVITNQPQSQIVLAGTNVTFSVGASGTGLFYHWFRNGLTVANGTNALLVLSNITVSADGAYMAGISNAAAKIVSNTAQLLVVNPPSSAQAPLLTNQATAGIFTLSFAAAAGYQYVVEYNASLDASSWVVLTNAGPSFSNNPVEIVQAIIAATNRFYRARVLPP